MREARKTQPDRQAVTVKKKPGKGIVAAGFLAAALGLSSDQGDRRVREHEEDEMETVQQHRTDRSPTPQASERARQTRQAFEQAIREAGDRARHHEEAPSLKILAETDVSHDDLMDFGETLVQENPNTAIANPKFLELLDTMQIDHDGTSYYLYTDSEDLRNRADQRSDVHLEALFVLEEQDDPYGDVEFVLRVFVETPQGARPLGRHYIISTPEQLKHRVADYVTDELVKLVILKSPEWPTP